MSLTRELVQLIRAKPIAQDDLDRAALFVLDTIACAFGGRHSIPGQILWNRARPASPGPASQAFVLGGLAHILEMDDLHRVSVTHPGCVVIPASWGVAASRGCDGRQFLGAVLHGYEAGARIGMAVGKAHYRLWHNTSTCGPFGSAMAVSTLLGLSEDQAVWALGNAGTQSCGLWQFLEEGAMSKHLHTARAAEAGLVSAELAAQGFTGPARILEGEKGLFRATCPDANPAAVLADPETDWQLRHTSIKPWPSCRQTHPAIEAGLALHPEVRGRPVASVSVNTYQSALDLCDRRAPSTEYEAKFSLQHCVAVALDAGSVTLDSFDEGARARMREMGEKVSLARSDAYETAYPERWGASVSIEMDDGESLQADRPCCKGDPESPLSAEDLRAKAVMLLEHGGLSSAAAASLIEAVLDLPHGGRLPSLDLGATSGPSD